MIRTLTKYSKFINHIIAKNVAERDTGYHEPAYHEPEYHEPHYGYSHGHDVHSFDYHSAAEDMFGPDPAVSLDEQYRK